MTKESLVHIKLEYSESIDAVRDLLSSEATLLKIAARIRDYKFYRGKEYELKAILSKKIREVKTSINVLNKALPKLQMPELIVKREQQKEKAAKEAYKGQHKIKKHIEKTPPVNPDVGIDEELQEIERKLRFLEHK